MELNEFRARIKNGALEGWYILSGEEDYLKKYYSDSLRRAVITDEAFAPFNHTLFDGQDIDFASLKEAITSAPMMSDYRLVEWRFANLDALKESERGVLDDLISMKEDYPYTILLIMTTSDGFDVGTQKKPSKLKTRLERGFEILNFEKSSDNQLILWLKKHFDAEGVSIDNQTLNALLFRSGHSMEVLNNEVIKLACYAKANGNSEVSSDDVELIASPAAESDAFALSNAVIERNVSAAFLAMNDLKSRRIEASAIVYMLERVYADLCSVALLLEEGKGSTDIEKILKFHPFKAKLYISCAKKSGVKRLSSALAQLRRIDASSKSGGLTGYGAVEMFITQNL